jgi:hypothetical protein
VVNGRGTEPIFRRGTHQVYATNVSQLTDLTLTSGVTITINEVSTGMGWAANATPAVQPGVVSCMNGRGSR